MATPTPDCALLCACGVSYAIGTSTPITDAAPYYAGAGFTSTPTVLTGLLPQTSACLVGITSAGIVVAFRGTVFSSIEDWITDILVAPIEMEGMPGKVHSGWALSLAEILNPLVDTLTPLLQNDPSQTVIFTGHSKGGAMASMAAYYLQYMKVVPAAQIQVTTFASPMPGDAAFAMMFQQDLSQVNYLNYLDMVPFLPPSAANAKLIASYFPDSTIIQDMMADFEQWNYTLCATEMKYIEQDGKVSTFPTWYLVFLDAVGNALTSGDPQQIEAVFAAHSHTCGGGYMTGVCGSSGICSGSN